MNRHIDDAVLNDYVEGLVPEDVAREVDGNLASCKECTARLEALALLLAELAGPPHDASPARDLWPGIQAQIGAGGAVSISRGRAAGNRIFSFPPAELVAASVVWTLLSGGAVWMALTARQDRAVVAVTEVTETAGARAESNMVLPVVGAATTEYERAIASLEFILEQGRDQLDPQTVETIEMSLNTIDRAIGEARQALSSDPNNAGLNRLLIKYVQSKLRVLRQASAAIQI
jgi:hypothetical protein